MPSRVVATPRTQAATMAPRTILRVTRSAVAAGPMSRAVDRIDPMAMEDRPTATAMANMNSRPTQRTADPAGRRRARG